MHDPSQYGDAFADVYDDWYDETFDTDATVAALTTLAGTGPVLELGVGTGRLAIPLAATGLTVVGVDASAAMLERLAAKPGAERVRVLHADMADLLGAAGDPAPMGPESAGPGLGPEALGAFTLVFAAYNTFFNLTGDDAQRRCLDQCARLLAPGGVLALEAFVPADTEVERTSLDVRSVTGDAVVLTATEHHATEQLIRGQHVELHAEGIRLRPWTVRYCTPDQLDEVARGAGLVRARRWGGWDGRPFDETCDAHVTLYRRPTDQ